MEDAIRLLPTVAIAAAMLRADPAPAQHPPAPPAQVRDDIVVEGDRLRDGGPLVSGVQAPGLRADVTSLMWENAVRAARCAAKGRITSLSLLSAVVDGTYNSAIHDRDQTRLTVQTRACGAGQGVVAHGLSPVQLSGQEDTIGRGNYLTQASIDERGTLARGAFILETINRYAPDLVLTTTQTGDPAIRQRLVDREVVRTRLMRSWDRQYLQVTLCMVAQRPDTSLRLLRADPDRRGYLALQNRLIEQTPDCTGHVRTVAANLHQFRGYLADAVYRWAIAARGVDTLVPLTRSAGPASG